MSPNGSALTHALARAIALALCASIASAAENPDRFRGLDWGVSSEAFPGELRLADEAGPVKLYDKVSDHLKVGTADLLSIAYVFYEDQFYRVLMSFEGDENASIILDSLKSKYGDGARPNRYTETRHWGIGGDVTITYSYSTIKDSGAVMYSYQPIVRLQQADAAQAAKEASDDI